MPAVSEIILDPSIRNWVLFPIFLVMFLQGVLRQYIAVLLKDDKKTALDAISKKSATTQQSAANSATLLSLPASPRSRCLRSLLCLPAVSCCVALLVCVPTPRTCHQPPSPCASAT